MAAHLKVPEKNPTPPRRKRSGGSAATARTAVTIAVAGAVSATGLAESGQAAPRPSPDQVRRQVDLLCQQAEAATQRYDGAQEQVTRMRGRLDALQAGPARRARQASTTRDQLGRLAAERYRTGGEAPALRLILTSSPGQYLERSEMLERANAVEAAALGRLSLQTVSRARARDTAQDELRSLEATQHKLEGERRGIEGRLDRAKGLLAQVSAARRARIEAAGPPAGASAAAHAVPASGTTAPGTAPNARAARAVAFAYAQIGKPYVWGATGPSAYDCSGLTRAAWAAAGVALPRTTYSQINAGRRITEARLRPGDLVFYHAGVSHVALYVGGGRIIHAPHPGAAVRLAPVGEMPFAGASRPA